jgi:hypothetical protein
MDFTEIDLQMQRACGVDWSHLWRLLLIWGVTSFSHVDNYRNFGVALICVEQAARRRIQKDNLHSHRRSGVKSDMVGKDRNN